MKKKILCTVELLGFKVGPILFLVIALSFACVPVTPTSPPYDFTTFIEDLRAASVVVEEGSTGTSELFSAPMQEIFLNRSYANVVTVLEYENAGKAKAEAAYVSPDGETISPPGKESSLGWDNAGWRATPHFFQRGKLLAVYIGENMAVYHALTEVLGPQFAGGDAPVPPPTSFKGFTLPLYEPYKSEGWAGNPPPAWLFAGEVGIPGHTVDFQTAFVSTEPAGVPSNLTATTLPTDGQIIVVFGHGGVSELQITLVPWTEGIYFPEPAPTEQQLQARVETEGNLTSFTFDLGGSEGNLQLDLFVTFPYRPPPAVSPGEGRVHYAWRLNAQSAPVQAVYLVQNPGHLSMDDLQLHPEVAVTDSFDEFKQYAQTKVALWVDKGAVSQVDNQWLHDAPQKYYPLALIGESNELCAFRETLTGFGIEGPPADCSVEAPGFSVWMLREETGTSISALMNGYTQQPTVQNILDITNALLEGKTK